MKSTQLLKRVHSAPGATLNTSASTNIGKFSALIKSFPNARLLNLGSGERFIGGQNLKRSDYGQRINLDIRISPSVQVIGDAHSIPFKDNIFHGVICQAVLEHTAHPEIVVDEIYRILKKGGYVYAEVPFLQGFHAAPSDYYRFTIQGIAVLFGKFKKIASSVCVGPSSAMSWIAREYLAGLLTGFSGSQRARRAALFFSGWITFPIKYLDMIFAKRPAAHTIASGVYFLGSKG